ncbi:uncharacterized protein LOC130752822 isoform X2 [Actinidia eriantha]|uniref:uncharacterized protein LOC130752822 isoform X2 n=1 Tax=Actinidia eriantha TaxID=165200 RepID=UPI0025894417|nr:uncharacterized protein LOC130752822 isoform X2 [Actinidia eriantha]
MPIKSPPITAASLVTVLCSHRFGLCNRPHFLSLNRPSPQILSLDRASSTVKVPFSPNPTSEVTSLSPEPPIRLHPPPLSTSQLFPTMSLLWPSYGFGAYFNILPGSEWSAIRLTYGFPLAIIGMALKYAELKPVPCLTYADAQMLRDKYATPILKQGGGIPRRSAPVLQMIREELMIAAILCRVFKACRRVFNACSVTPVSQVNEDGKYCLVMVFEAKAL